MRVLMLSWEYPPHVEGGMGQHVQHLAPALSSADDTLELHLITPTFTGKAHQQARGRLTIHWLPVAAPQQEHLYHDVLQANGEFERRARELHRAVGGFDLLHVHDWLVSFAARSLHSSEHIPLVSTIHATERGRNRGYLHSAVQLSIDAAERELAHASDIIIVCSRAMHFEVQSYFAVPPDKLRVIPNGVDGRHFDLLRLQDHSEFRSQFARPDEQIIFNVGRLVYEKGADLLVEATPRVLQRIPEIKVVIGGRGPLSPSLEQRVHDLRLEDKVLLTGYLSDEDRDRLYVLARCCVFPSRYEPFGIVALESMAAGAPVVVTDVGGLATVVVHEETGITVFTENVDSLAWGILRTLEDPALTRELVNRASVAARERFSWPIVARETLAVYREASSLDRPLPAPAD